MSNGIHIVRFATVLKVRVGDEVIEPNMGYLPWVLGENLAGQVDPWVMEQRLGYYPALDFFRDKPQVVDPALLLLIDAMARFGEEYTRRELRRRLRGGFSHVDVERIQVEAFAMPRIRPSQPKSPEELAKHYAPATFRVELLLGMIQRGEVERIERLVASRIQQWAKPAFHTLELLSTRQLGE
ncbi:MAG TPA: hypothetical protein VGE00_09065 [Gammaproteobacteria bacterium]